VFLFWLFVFVVAVQCRYVFYTFMRVFSLKVGMPLTVQQRQPVSIIICAKNEAANLLNNLPLILTQRYSNDAGIELYEVIVINDNSNDNTARVLAGLQQQYAHLKIIHSGPDDQRILKGKKHALSIAVAHTSCEWLLLTDADCAPASDQWLALMTAPLANKKEIVAGYGGYGTTAGMLNAFIRWETLHTFIQYSSYALAGRPYMAVGRNMACTKKALLKAQSSHVWNALPSGDDDLLVNIVGTADNMAIVCDPLAFTFSEAKETWHGWVLQKQRHLSAGKYYKWPVKLSLALYASSHALSWLLFFILLLIHHPLAGFAVVYMLFRCLASWATLAITARKLQEKKLFYFFPLFDLGWMVYNFVFFPYITWKNKTTWT